MTAYFHGGARGLKRGDRILPPSETGAASLYDFDGAPAAMKTEAARVYRRDRVYLTTDLLAARLYAALHRDGGRTYGGSVYQVEPEGDIEPDLDYKADDGGSIAVRAGRITRVIDRKVARAMFAKAMGADW